MGNPRCEADTYYHPTTSTSVKSSDILVFGRLLDQRVGHMSPHDGKPKGDANPGGPIRASLLSRRSMSSVLETASKEGYNTIRIQESTYCNAAIGGRDNQQHGHVQKRPGTIQVERHISTSGGDVDSGRTYSTERIRRQHHKRTSTAQFVGNFGRLHTVVDHFCAAADKNYQVHQVGQNEAYGGRGRRYRADVSRGPEFDSVGRKQD